MKTRLQFTDCRKLKSFGYISVADSVNTTPLTTLPLFCVSLPNSAASRATYVNYTA